MLAVRSCPRLPRCRPSRWPSAASGEPQAILIVGAERAEEFAQALRLGARGHSVLVANPRETEAARRFQVAGGRFRRSRIEDLPPRCGGFDLIREHYPYPSGRHYVPPLPFAIARLERLAPCGRWVLYTEAVRFATLLKAAAEHDLRLAGRFTVGMRRVRFDAAPASDYPQSETRFQLIFRRLH